MKVCEGLSLLALVFGKEKSFLAAAAPWGMHLSLCLACINNVYSQNQVTLMMHGSSHQSGRVS